MKDVYKRQAHGKPGIMRIFDHIWRFDTGMRSRLLRRCLLYTSVPIRELFEEDRKALLMLPPKRFDVCRYEWLKADGYGKVCMDGKHFYSTRPENANKQVLVGIRAHTVDILTEGGQVVTTHRRAYGDNRTDISDYSTTLAVLMKNSGA